MSKPSLKYEVHPLFGPTEVEVKILHNLGFRDVQVVEDGNYLLVTFDPKGVDQRQKIEALGWRVVVAGPYRSTRPFTPGCTKPGQY